MSHKLEDLQAKTNKFIEEAVKTGLPSGEHREDGGDEDTQPTTATITLNGKNLKEVAFFTYLGGAASFQLWAAQAQTRMSKPGSEKQQDSLQSEVSVEIYCTQHKA
ncbi:unnamed protein product [Heterobilharzia americana]|nr:unnamed protein product [Heterobilharzia americana]